VKNGNLSTAVSGLELITADGEIVHLSRERDGERFAGAVVDLGAFGVVTKATLDIQPTFQMRQVVYENLPFSALERNLEEIFAAGYSVSLFTDWQHHRATQVWIKSRVEPGRNARIAPTFFGATVAKVKLHPLAGHSAENCTEQQGIPGPWYERMPHFRMNFTPSSGAELQTEYFVERGRGWEAIQAVEKLRDQITPHLFITELRAIAEDSLWMSEAYQRQAMAIHFTWKPEWPEVKAVLPNIENALEPFQARPHWAKLFTMKSARLQSLYPRLKDFRALAQDFDPGGKFRNGFLNETIFA
jgi:xylitol oxidase